MKSLIIPILICVFLAPVSLPRANALVKLGATTGNEIKGVKLVENAKVEENSQALPRVTQGLRQKKVVFAWFSVYVAQVFSAVAKPDFSSIQKLSESLKKSMPLVISMTFLRDVGIDKISEGFSEGFKENKMDTTHAPFSDFLSAIQKSGDVTDGQQFYFVFSENSGKESLSVQTRGKEIFSLKDQNSATVETFLNLWFGKPADSGLEQLQEQLLKPQS